MTTHDVTLRAALAAAVRTLGATDARIHSVDIVRGAVLVLMVLDHVRDFFSNALVSPTDLAHASPELFLTRWITHFCAPVFVMLTGTSAFLSAHSRALTRTELARYLVTRGVWLVVLELTVVRFGWLFNLEYEVVFGQVIWALGWSMVLLAGLVFFRMWAVLLFGGALILGHNLLDGVDPSAFGALSGVWRILHAPGRIELASGHLFFVSYSIVPWVGVMALGYGIGPLFTLEAKARQRWLFLLGSALTVGFVLVRAVNGYGDPKPWVPHDSVLLTVLSFLNCTKYPPSMDYLFMTLGPALVALALLDRPPGRLGGVLEVFGRVPLFFYLIHLPVVHGLAVALAAARHEDIAWLFGAPGASPIPSPPSVDDGVSLPVVYAIWLGTVILLYPVCRWYADMKRRRSDLRWLRYL